MPDQIELTKDALDRIPQAAVDGALGPIGVTFDVKKRVFVAGNGGSSATAAHLVEDLRTCVRPEKDWRGLQAHDLGHGPTVTAYANDVDYDVVFSYQLEDFQLQEDDVVILFSGSGMSSNVLLAAQKAIAANCWLVAVTGFTGGNLRVMAQNYAKGFDVWCEVVGKDGLSLIDDKVTMEITENCHAAVGHLLVSGVREYLKDRPENA